MRGKLLFLTGGLAGYVLGARAGRKRYEQIKASAADLWNSKPVKRRVSEVQDFALDALGDVAPALLGQAKKLLSSATSGKKNSGADADAGRSSQPAASNTEQSTAAVPDPFPGAV